MFNKNKESDKENIKKETEENSNNVDTTAETDKPAEKNADLVAAEEKVAELQDKYLRLNAEFDNYRKRTVKERCDLIKTAGEDIIQGLLPVIDDFDRALSVIQNAADNQSVKEGVQLIYDKLMTYLKQKGLVEVEAAGKDFDTDHHEAISKFTVSEADKKGKVMDVAQKGYMLNDKVIRYAKVVVGE